MHQLEKYMIYVPLLIMTLTLLGIFVIMIGLCMKGIRNYNSTSTHKLEEREQNVEEPIYDEPQFLNDPQFQYYEQ